MMTDVFMLQGYQERRASRALAASKGRSGPMEAKEKRGMLDQRVPEVSFPALILTLLLKASLEIPHDENMGLPTATLSL